MLYQNKVVLFRFFLIFSTVLFVSFIAHESLADDAIEIEGKHFLKGGEPWVAEGVVLVGYVAPKNVLKNKASYLRARTKFSDNLLRDIQKFGADSIRFQVSQGGLDPRSSIYDLKYRDEVLEAVRKARRAGFNVVVSMQWQKASGSPDEGGMPTETTKRAWKQLAHALAKDRGVILELFNEPKIRKPTSANWEKWRVSMQGLVDFLRKEGSQNVLLVNGLRAAHILNGAPQLEDPLGQVGYAVHPYLDKVNQYEQQWDENFGDFAKRNPVIATEFMSESRRACRKTLPEETEKLLEYMKQKKIGLMLWAFDLGNIRRGKSLTNFDELSCHQGGKKGGGGEMLHDYFMQK